MKKNNLIILIAIALVTTLLFFSCDFFNETEELKPGRRDYTWTIDTLGVKYGILTDIWGSAPDDIWAVGPIDADENLWHYNGKEWSKKQIPNNINPKAIFGFAEDDIWIGGGNKAFWHYDGTIWSKTDEFEIEGYPWWGPTTLWGDAPNNVYMAGYKQDSEQIVYGMIMHYDGTSWEIIETELLEAAFVLLKRGTKTSSNYYLWTLRVEAHAIDTSAIYEFNGKELKEIYKGPEYKDKSVFIAEIDNEMYFTFGKTIKKYNGKGFYELFNVPFESFAGGLFGRNRNDIFLNMRDGIAHYNGSNIEYIYNYGASDISMRGNIVFQQEVVLLAYDFTNHLNLVITGMLN